MSHTQAFELLPWLVNGSLSGTELDSVQSHVRSCVTCRIAIREQQQLRAAIREQPTVPLSAEQGFERLTRQLEESAVVTDILSARRLLGSSAPARLAAAAVLLAAVVGVAWLVDSGVDRTPQFTTLGEEAAIDEPRIDLIFAAWVSESDMRALLSDINATIVGGPSDIGRYTVRIGGNALSEADVAALLERLASDRRIRFAGRTMISEESSQ
jgi:hypothetical protein